MNNYCERCGHLHMSHAIGTTGIGACSVSMCECWGYKAKAA